MRKLIAIIALCSFAFATDEIRRPGSDSDTGSSTWATNNCGVGTYTANAVAGTLARDAAGQATNIDYTQSGSFSTTKLTSRTFTSWAAASNTYTTLTLNINSASAGGLSVGDNACVVYSVDSGSTWTQIRCDATATGWTQTTDTVTISASLSLAKLRVGVCVLGQSGSGSDDIRLYDIWTDGVYSVVVSGSGNTTRVRRPGIVFFD